MSPKPIPPRQRWPVRNADELTRHVARQFPEFKRRQIMAILNAALLAIRDSLLEQARQSAERPHVTLLNFGSFELRRHGETRRPYLGGGLQVVPERWRAGFRPSERWAPRLDDIPTRTSAQEHAGENNPPETFPCPAPLDEEAPRGLPDVPPGSQS